MTTIKLRAKHNWSDELQNIMFHKDQIYLFNVKLTDGGGNWLVTTDDTGCENIVSPYQQIQHFERVA